MHQQNSIHQNFDSNDLNKDEMINYDSSKTVYTDIIGDLQKKNVKLETEKIELEVKVKQLDEEKNRLLKEKENLNKKYLNADQERQKYLTERDIYDRQHLEVLNSKEYEISLMNEQFIELNETCRLIESERNQLLTVKQEYEQIKIAYNDTTNAYQTLYSQASELHNTNQSLDSDLVKTKCLNEELKQSLDELAIKLEHLEGDNSELNRNNIAIKLKTKELKQKLDEKLNEIEKNNIYKQELATISELNNQIQNLNTEIVNKNEMIEQLNQAKDFLKNANSQLLVKNVKMQLYLELKNVDYEHVEKSSIVREYEDLKFENSDLKLKNDTLNNQISSQNIMFKKLTNEITDLNDKVSESNFLNQELNEQMQKKAEEINDKSEQYNLLKKKAIKLKQTIRQLESQQSNSVIHSDIQTNAIEIVGDVNNVTSDKKL